MQLGYLPSLKTSLQSLPLSSPSPSHPSGAVGRGPPKEGPPRLGHGPSVSKYPLTTTMLCGKGWQRRSLSVERGTRVSWYTPQVCGVCMLSCLAEAILLLVSECYKLVRSSTACGVCNSLAMYTMHLVMYVQCMYIVSKFRPSTILCFHSTGQNCRRLAHIICYLWGLS